jgi:TRAP-type mannitol/chloroaromatic compound transport system permease large subunit
VIVASITDVFAGVLPFMTAYIACVIVLLVVPGIATWLPNALR